MPPMTAAPLENLKGNTWYYGLRCACQRVLAVCEDRFQGKGREAVLHVPIEFAVECECGKVTRTPVLRKFKTP